MEFFKSNIYIINYEITLRLTCNFFFFRLLKESLDLD